MTRFTDCDGKHTILCDNCHLPMTAGNSVFSISPGKVSDGYIARDYEKGEIVLCAACAEQLSRLVTLLSGVNLRVDLTRYLNFSCAQIAPPQPSVSI